jgi:hypothetical protein
MCHRYLGGALLAAMALLAGPSAARAQLTGGEGGGFQTPLNSGPLSVLPTGHSGDAGFYGGMEFVMLTQTRAIGNQTIAKRGFYDISGAFTGTPGAFIGDGDVAISPKLFGNRTFQPGFNLEIGYRFGDGTRAFLRYMQLYDAHYSLGASPIPPFFDTRTDLANTFLSSPVHNFTNFFAGPPGKVNGVPDSSVYGIWNAASQMDIKFTQRFQQLQAGVRVPVLQSEYSRVYGAAGFQFSWFFERFFWRTVSQDQAGNASTHDAARYTNTLSQRMYGPFLGCGHEIFVANQFSLSLDLTGAILLNVEKQRAKYILEDQTVQSKWGREDFHMVPNANAEVNLWWYPIEGVQMRIGYQAMTFFNTQYMRDPVGFNYGNIQPGYSTKYFRLLHGFNVGVGFFF